MEQIAKQVINKILAEHKTLYKAHKHTGIARSVYSRLLHKPTLANIQRVAKVHNIQLNLGVTIG